MLVCDYLILFLAYGFSEYIFDMWKATKDGFYDKCKNNMEFHMRNLLHHILFGFIFTGWLCDDPVVLAFYVITLWIILLNWEENGGYCSLTLQLNEMCEQPKESYFRDFFYWIGLKTSTYGEILYRVYIFFGMIVAMTKLWQKWKCSRKL